MDHAMIFIYSFIGDQYYYLTEHHDERIMFYVDSFNA